MSKENIWVLGLVAVPLIGMSLSRRSACGGSPVSSDCAQAGLPRNSRPAAAVKTDHRQNLPAAVLREPLLARIPSSHALVSDADGRSYRPLGTIPCRGDTSTPRLPLPADKFFLMLCWSRARESPR